MKIVGVDDVEDMVLDGGSFGGRGDPLDRNGGVDLLEGQSVQVEFTVEQPVGGNDAVEVHEKMLDDIGVPELTLFFTKSAGLHLSLVVECADSVEFRLNEEWEG